MSHNALKIVVLLDEFQGSLGSDALDRLEVITAAQHAHLDELAGHTE